VLLGGVLGGVSGATLVLAQAERSRKDVGGARLHRDRHRRTRSLASVGAAVAAIVFGAASALQFLFQAMGWSAPYQLFLVLPYVLTLIALATTRGRRGAPAALGRREL